MDMKRLLLYNREFFPLDKLPTSAFAVSLRRLRKNYVGSAIRVRRSSDNDEIDIGFTSNNQLDIFKLLQFVGSGNGFITIWYNQNGSSERLVQLTAQRQPSIVISGVVTTNNGRPSIYFDGVDDVLSSTSFFINAAIANLPFTFTFVSGGTNVSFGYSGNLSLGVGAIPRLYLLRGSLSYVSNSTIGIPSTPGTLVTTYQHDGINKAFAFSNSRFVGTATETVSSNFAGGYLSVPFYAGGVAQQGFTNEAILFASFLSASQRQFLEQNQGEYFGLPIN